MTMKNLFKRKQAGQVSKMGMVNFEEVVTVSSHEDTDSEFDDTIHTTVQEDSHQNNDRSNNSCLVHITQESSLRNPYKRKASHDKRIQWDCLIVHTHIMELSDNPSVSGGVPVGIGWKAVETRTLSIDKYEQTKGTSRTKAELVLPRFFRDELARDAGASRVEMRNTVVSIRKIQEQRLQSSRDGMWRSRLSQLPLFRTSQVAATQA